MKLHSRDAVSRSVRNHFAFAVSTSSRSAACVSRNGILFVFRNMALRFAHTQSFAHRFVVLVLFFWRTLHFLLQPLFGETQFFVLDTQRFSHSGHQILVEGGDVSADWTQNHAHPAPSTAVRNGFANEHDFSSIIIIIIIAIIATNLDALCRRC